MIQQKEKSEKQASDTHYIVGKTIRETIKQLGNPMPEELPTPNKSIKELERITNQGENICQKQKHIKKKYLRK